MLKDSQYVYVIERRLLHAKLLRAYSERQPADHKRVWYNASVPPALMHPSRKDSATQEYAMPRVSQPAAPAFPTLDGTLLALNVDDLKWYLGALPGPVPSRKPELVAALKQALTDDATLQSLVSRLDAVQQQVIAEVAHQLGGQYNAGLIEAKYPGSPLPKGPRGYSASFYVFGAKKEPITPFDVFFFYNYELGRYIPADLAARLRELLPAPAPAQLASQAKPPAIRMQK
jgi:hypothetical protein